MRKFEVTDKKNLFYKQTGVLIRENPHDVALNIEGQPYAIIFDKSAVRETR